MNNDIDYKGGWSWGSVATPLSLFYFFYFSFLGCLLPFWPVFLKEQGFTGYQIGLVQAIFLGTKIFAPSIAGLISDHTGLRVQVIRVGVVGAGVFFSLFLLPFTLSELLLYSFLYSLFWNAILSQFEAYTLEALGPKASKYSKIRMWGSIGFIVFSVGLGLLFDYASLQWLPVIMLGVIGMAGVLSFSLPELISKHSAREEQESTKSIIPLLRRKDIQAFLLICFLTQVSHGSYYSFYSLYMKEFGYSTTWVGGLWAFAVVAEVVLFLMFPAWVKKRGAYFLLLLSIVLTVVRWLVIGAFPQILGFVVIGQALHAFSFGCLHVVSMLYVQQYFSREFSGRGQALYSGVSFGLGGAAGALISGILWEQTEHDVLFYFAAFSALISLLVVRRMKN